MKILTILGARPQFIKAASVSRVIKGRDDIEEIILHTGQHFDVNMSDIFFEQLDIPRPDYNLQISGLSHGAMTGRMLEGIEKVIHEVNPNWVLVYGDTNSTLAGAVAAAKMHVPVAHVEAGLRSHNPAMPEEVNRVLTDRVSSLLLCPTHTAVSNLQREGFPFSAIGANYAQISQCIFNIGDVMLDVTLYYRDRAEERVSLDLFGVSHKEYALCTLHRQENTDDPERLDGILSALREIADNLPLVLPLHPRTKYKIEEQLNPHALHGIKVLEPLPYLEMQRLQMSAKFIVTDSGGMQKEAYFHSVPCITLRDETEWTETLEGRWNQLAGANRDRILEAWENSSKPGMQSLNVYGAGDAANKVLENLVSWH